MGYEKKANYYKGALRPFSLFKGTGPRLKRKKDAALLRALEKGCISSLKGKRKRSSPLAFQISVFFLLEVKERHLLFVR